MDLSKQVISLDLAKRLKELGAPQDSCFIYLNNNLQYRDLCPYAITYVAAYTVAELGEMLPESIDKPTTRDWYVLYMSRFAGNCYHADYCLPPHHEVGESFDSEVSPVSMADAYGLMLAWLIENGYISFTDKKEV